VTHEITASHFTTLKMMEGYSRAPEHIKTTHAGSMRSASEALRKGEVAAVSLMEPWIQLRTKTGAAHPDRIPFDPQRSGERRTPMAKTLAAMFRAQARAVKALERGSDRPHAHYLTDETGGLLQPHELQTWRLLHAAPQPYTRERFDDTYNWTVKWDMTVPGAPSENIVDNRAFE